MKFWRRSAEPASPLLFELRSMDRRGNCPHVVPVYPPYESCWQIECQLFVQSPLRSGRDLPRMRNESRPAKLVMVVTDF
jgi:hypothetical protein